jgi:putative transposase
LGACRWLKGHALDLRSSAHRLYGLKLTGVDVSRMVTGWKKTPGHEWLAEVPATCLTQALRDQDRAFSNFLAGRAKYPKRPRRGHRESLRFQDVSVAKWEAGILRLPKLGRGMCGRLLRYSASPLAVPAPSGVP